MHNNIITHGTNEWYRQRLGRITASNFGCLMAKPNDRSRVWSVEGQNYLTRKAYEVIIDKYIYDKPYSPVAANWGLKHESNALTKLRIDQNWNIKDLGLVFYEENNQIAPTPDGCIWDNNLNIVTSLIQVKCPYNGNYHDKYSSTIFDEIDLKRRKGSYYWQIQGEMWVSGSKSCYFVSFDPRRETNKQIHTALIARVDSDIKILSQKVFEALEFRNKLVEDLKTGKSNLPFFLKPNFLPRPDSAHQYPRLI